MIKNNKKKFQKFVRMRPSDEEILKQEDMIRKEVCESCPLIGPLEPIQLIQDDYKDGSQSIYSKICQLPSSSTVRRVRGDGNCFFRAVAFELIQQIDQNNYPKLLVFINRIFKEVGFDKMATGDFIDELTELVNEKHSADSLAEEWQKNEYRSQAVVVVLRLLTSSYLRQHASDYAPFIYDVSDAESETDVDKLVISFCQRQVECIGIESDQIHIIALCNALRAKITIIYIDSISEDKMTFEPEENEEKGKILVELSLLYRPGHYDLIYFNS
jgi:ubiquitin thioesterase protein OTUB1